MPNRFCRNGLCAWHFLYVECSSKNMALFTFQCIFELLNTRRSQHMQLHIPVHILPLSSFFSLFCLVCQWHVGHVVLWQSFNLHTKNWHFKLSVKKVDCWVFIMEGWGLGWLHLEMLLALAWWEEWWRLGIKNGGWPLMASSDGGVAPCFQQNAVIDGWMMVMTLVHWSMEHS